MPIAAILALIQEFGPSAVDLVTFLISKFETNGAVSSAEWAAQITALKRTASDEMTDRLKAAGIDPTSPQGVALLAATK